MAGVAPQQMQGLAQALVGATPQTQLMASQNQQLADMLQQTQEQGSKHSSSWAALAANLAASALDRNNLNDSTQSLIARAVNDRQAQSDSMLSSIGANAPTPTPAPQSFPPVSASPSLADIIQPPTPAATAPPLGNNDSLALARMVYGEARGEPADGQLATASVAMNRAKESGQSLANVISAPKQFDGYPAGAKLASNDPRLQPIMHTLAGLIDGSQQPTTNADHFYAPAGMPGGKPPSWDNGSGQMIGNQNFLALGYGGHPALAASAATTPQQAGGSPSVPYQVASNGPMPPPPQSAMGGPSQGAQSPPQPQGGPMPPQQPMSPPAPAQQPQGGPPTGPAATPQEIALVRQYMSNPQTFEQGRAMAMQIQQRMATRPAAPEKMMWSGNQVVPIPGTQTQQLQAPNPFDLRQKDAFGNISDSAIPGTIGRGIPEGYYFDPTSNSLKPLARPQVTQQGNFAPGTVTETDPATGQKTVKQTPQFGANDINGVLKDLTTSPEYQKQNANTEIYNAAVAAAGRPGGIPDAQLIDDAARLYSGGTAKAFNQKMIENGQGPITKLKQFIPELLTGQKLSPEGRQALLQSMYEESQLSQQGFRNLAQSRVDAAKQLSGGFDLSPYTAPLTRGLTPVPTVAGIPNGSLQQSGGANAGGGARGGPGSTPNAGPSLQELLAEKARRQAQRPTP